MFEPAASKWEAGSTIFYRLDQNLVPLQTYLFLNQSTASRYQLAHFLQRSGWLKFGRVGAFTEDVLACVESGDYGPIFLRLSDPEEYVPEPFLHALRRHPVVIITSPYPQHLFNSLDLKPFDFLTEPYSFERFTNCVNRYAALYT